MAPGAPSGFSMPPSRVPLAPGALAVALGSNAARNVLQQLSYGHLFGS